MSHFYFFIALAFIITHEMDAIRCAEWRIFPLLSKLDDQTGYLVFVVAHIPLFGIMFYFLFVHLSKFNQQLATGLDIFFIVHIGLHLLLLKNPKNKFTNFTSWFFIVGAGFFGLLDLLLYY